MTDKAKSSEIDFTRNPFRGTFVNVAKKMSIQRGRDISVQNVHDKYKRDDPLVAKMVIDEVLKRKNVISEKNELTGGVQV